MKTIFLCIFCISVAFSQAQPSVDPVGTIKSTRETAVHDPVMIKEGNRYYIFCTGMGISVFSSSDMQQWKKEKSVFDKAPQWAVDIIPGFKGHIWAPDISYHNGKFYLYYAVSAFGKNTSAIGLAVNKTLDPASPDFKWEDKGKVIQSVPGRDMWNAIDPNLISDENGTAWLNFGSFWNGIKMLKMSQNLESVAEPQVWFTIASRQRNFILPDSTAGDAAIEAPFIYKKDKYYYLFVSFDYCCRGEKSTYKVVVGRSEKIQGPYVDRDGVAMNLGGGSTVVEGNKEWHGAGHNAVVNVDGADYIIYHGYDAADKGRSKLRIDKLSWWDGWPIIKQ
ncbi:MAG: arabinan endo-1,5-alpha-L-arabinosidase [Chitinophagaceae bacterium]